MKLINAKKGELSVVEKYQRLLKKVEFAVFVFAGISMLLSQFEYELYYYPNHYFNNPPTPENYNGLAPRIIYTCLSFLLGKIKKN